MNTTITMLKKNDIQTDSEPIIVVMPPCSNLKLRKSKTEKKYALCCRNNGKHTDFVYDDYRIIDGTTIVVRLGDTWYDVEDYSDFSLDCLHLKAHGCFTQKDVEQCPTIKLESLMLEYANTVLINTYMPGSSITQTEKLNRIRDIIDEIYDRIGNGRVC